MSTNNRGLGRGLASLIPSKGKLFKEAAGGRGKDFLKAREQLPATASSNLRGNFLEAEISRIIANPHQPRSDFNNDSLRELTQSIKEHGIIQPLVVTRLADGQFELVAGERRLKAAKQAGLKKVPVVIKKKADDKDKLELALVENIQRRDLNPIEEAKAFKKLMEEFGLTQEEIAGRVSKSRSAVANKLRLLTLPVEIQKAVIDEKITEGHARSILAVENPEKQRALFQMVISGKMTVRQVEDKVRETTVSTHRRRIGAPVAISEFKDEEEKIASSLGTKVNIKRSGRGGKIIIDFYSREELSDIVKKFGL